MQIRKVKAALVDLFVVDETELIVEPVPQSRLTVYAGVSFGMPAFMPTTRAMYMSSGRVWMTLPKTTCPTSAPSTLARASASLTTSAPSCCPASMAEAARS